MKDWEPYLEDPGYQSPEDAHVPLYSPRPKWSYIEAVRDEFSFEPAEIQEQDPIHPTLPEASAVIKDDPEEDSPDFIIHGGVCQNWIVEDVPTIVRLSK